MEKENDKKTTEVKCFHCEHQWKTISKAIMVTCPSCIRKTVRVVEVLE